MKVLIACEESQAVCKEFRKLGHEAYSCDIQECSGGHPEWHIQGDAFEVIESKSWDMVIAFPPCTHLSLSGAKHFAKKRESGVQRSGIEFFAKMLNIDCPMVAIENPMNIMSGGKYLKEHYPDLCEKYCLPRKYSQTVQPYEYGDPAQKTTRLWLKGLPGLIPTTHESEQDKGEFVTTPSGKRLPKWYSDNKSGKHRSKTFSGMARAMAIQWGGKAQALRGD
ncbi:putative DNA cytosine methyltransferase [Vibrio phage 282E43-1]|nr:putative DNA cytosine methyltransferase [Vibrio phage 282E43-1]